MNPARLMAARLGGARPGMPRAEGPGRPQPAAMAAFLTHQQKVLRLYKKSLRHLESWCIHR